VKKIEVRGRGAKGSYRLNEYRGDNAAALSSRQRRRELRREAERAAERWMRVLPDDEIKVEEVSDG